MGAVAKINTGFESCKYTGVSSKNNSNVWLVRIGDWETLVSYGKNVVHRNVKTGEVYLDSRYFEKSFTTAVQRESYLGNPKPFERDFETGRAVVLDSGTRKYIANGRYKLADLN